MGVPNLYRWLSERYPLINRPVNKLPMPEIDNFYLDANGILHTCTHGDNAEVKGGSEEEQLIAICSAIDSMVQLVRPKRLLYIAIDGVAPRAKMNQQRQRRYRVARERRQAVRQATAAAEAAKAAAATHPPGDAAADAVAADAAGRRAGGRPGGRSAPAADATPTSVAAAGGGFDSNCITPGTAFMSRVAEALRFIIRHKLQSDQLWAGLRVVLSGADVPGEGEHKIAAHIRSERELPRRHCVYGLDADLIMLALATHAPAIVILREKVVFRGKKSSEVRSVSLKATGDYILLHAALLRRYLDLEFRTMVLPFAYSLERVVDDLLVLSFLCGNDFLPHPPPLDIREGGLDLLFASYKLLLASLGGYLTEGPKIDAARLATLLSHVAGAELAFLKAGEKERKEAMREASAAAAAAAARPYCRRRRRAARGGGAAAAGEVNEVPPVAP